MRRRRKVVGSVADCGLALEAGEGAGMAALAVFGPSRTDTGVLVALEGTDIGEGRRFSILNFVNSAPALTGLVKTGVRALRNCV